MIQRRVRPNGSLIAELISLKSASLYNYDGTSTNTHCESNTTVTFTRP